VLLSPVPRLLLATRQSGKSTAAALKAALDSAAGGPAVVVSPSLRQSGFLFRKLAVTSSPLTPASDAPLPQEYFGAFVSAPGSVFDAEVLAHMFGDDCADEPDAPASIVQGALVGRFLQ